jgi:hypothetical protein
MAYFFYFSPKTQIIFEKWLINQDSVAFALFDKEAIANQIVLLAPDQQKKYLFQDWASTTNVYLSKTGLDFKKDILDLFKKDIGLGIYKANDETPFPFVIILEKHAASTQINSVLNLFSQQFKSDFDLSDEIYRQNRITILKPINGQKSIYYSPVGDYFLISDSLSYLKKTIDKIIKN